MRIISGIARGLIINTPPGQATRPIPDRLKETLFNILFSWDKIHGMRWCDFFSGAGSIGLEALSRGAVRCVFAEKDKKAHNYLVKNLEKTKFTDRAEAHRMDTEMVIARLFRTKQTFDIVSLDPPFDMFNQWLQRLNPDADIIQDDRDLFEGLDHIIELDLIDDGKGNFIPDPEQPEVIAARRKLSRGPNLTLGEKFDRIFHAALKLLAEDGILIIRGESIGHTFQAPEGYKLEVREYGRNILYFVDRLSADKE